MNKHNQEKMQAVADKVIKLMETEKGNWFKPFASYTRRPNNYFTSNLAYNITSMNNYSGWNTFSLGLNHMLYESSAYATFKQINAMGGSVKKGEKGTHVCYYGQADKKDEDNNKSSYRFLKFYSVFNLEQTNLDPKEIEEEALAKQKDQKQLDAKKYALRKIPTIDDLELFIKNTSAQIEHKEAGRCYYSPSLDYINMSPLDTWKSDKFGSKQDYYYSTLFHELVHWTKGEHRANRDAKNPYESRSFGSKGYAFEELCAELGSAMLSSTLGLTKVPMENHAQYLNSWMQALKENPEYLMKASSLSQQAVNYVYDLQPKTAELEKVA
jgi:antirestriction protein ArdC